ncbi:MAG: Gfo/Idh/MocA family oxidoreductase [Lactimicrobium sp.]|uniref:Gfo/Idh/MocA family protein n=1 Tax=Lactimicrobium sp. TaxID=2563780 RepID=UPI002F352398
MKIGFLGAGMIVLDLMRTIDQIPFEKKVILGTEHNRERTEELARRFGFARTYYDYDELLASDVDTVYVALPNHLHYSFAKKALEAGKHVIIEKPITANDEELESLKKIAAEKHLMIFEAMSVVHMPAYLAIKEKLPELGNIKIISLNYSQYSHRYDAFKAGTILPVFDPHKAGGALMDLNVYNISFICGLFGEPKHVSYHANIEKGIDTSGILTMDYGTFQAVSIAAKDCKAPVSCSIQGDAGCIAMHSSVNGMTSFDLDRNDGSVEPYNDNSGRHRMLYEFLDFIQTVDTKDYAHMEEMLEASSMVSRVMETARKDAGIIFDNDINIKGEQL